MAREHKFVFCYDVASSKVRRRMAEILDDEGTRVQKSAFEVRCTLQRVERPLTRLSAERLAGDSIRTYCLTEEARARSRAAGDTLIPERTEYWLS